MLTFIPKNYVRRVKAHFHIQKCAYSNFHLVIMSIAIELTATFFHIQIKVNSHDKNTYSAAGNQPIVLNHRHLLYAMIMTPMSDIDYIMLTLKDP